MKTIKQLLADAQGKDRSTIEEMIAAEQAGQNRVTAIDGLRELLGDVVDEPSLSDERTWRNSRDGRVRTFRRGSYADRRYASFPMWVEVE